MSAGPEYAPPPFNGYCGDHLPCQENGCYNEYQTNGFHGRIDVSILVDGYLLILPENSLHSKCRLMTAKGEEGWLFSAYLDNFSGRRMPLGSFLLEGHPLAFVLWFSVSRPDMQGANG